MNRVSFLPAVIFILVLFLGCQENPKTKVLVPITISKVYPGDILEVDRIELLDGSSGDRKTIKDRSQIIQWISHIKEIELIPDKDQQPRVGNIYNISLFKGEIKKLGFVSNEINGVYYKSNLEFQGYIKAFFEEQFGRHF